MKTSGLNNIKKELSSYNQQQLLDTLLRLIRFKTENKELVSYLLFDKDDLSTYIADLRTDIDDLLKDVHHMPTFMVKRVLRKALRTISRYSRYTQIKETEAELLLHLCRIMKTKGLNDTYSKVINTIYVKQLEKIRKMIPSLHKDLQFDYLAELQNLD